MPVSLFSFVLLFAQYFTLNFRSLALVTSCLRYSYPLCQKLANCLRLSELANCPNHKNFGVQAASTGYQSAIVSINWFELLSCRQIWTVVYEPKTLEKKKDLIPHTRFNPLHATGLFLYSLETLEPSGIPTFSGGIERE